MANEIQGITALTACQGAQVDALPGIYVSAGFWLGLVLMKLAAAIVLVIGARYVWRLMARDYLLTRAARVLAVFSISLLAGRELAQAAQVLGAWLYAAGVQL